MCTLSPKNFDRSLEPLHLVHSFGESQLWCPAGLVLWQRDTVGLGWRRPSTTSPGANDRHLSELWATSRPVVSAPSKPAPTLRARRRRTILCRACPRLTKNAKEIFKTQPRHTREECAAHLLELEPKWLEPKWLRFRAQKETSFQEVRKYHKLFAATKHLKHRFWLDLIFSFYLKVRPRNHVAGR